VLDLHAAHDLQACVTTVEQALRQARANPRAPVAIHARTLKGFGVQKTVASNSGGHGFPLKDPSELPAFLAEIYTGHEVPEAFRAWMKDLEDQVAQKKAQKKTANAQAGAQHPANAQAHAQHHTEKVQAGVSRALIRKREEGLPIVSISADLP